MRRYAVVVKKDGYRLVDTPDCTAVEAARYAAQEAAEYPNYQIFVEFFRESDGQHGYLNPDGNHAVVGERW